MLLVVAFFAGVAAVGLGVTLADDFFMTIAVDVIWEYYYSCLEDEGLLI